MSVGLITILIWIAFFALMLAGFPVAFSLLAVAIGGYLVVAGPHVLYAIVPISFHNLTLDVYIAIPLFVFMASLLLVAGIAERLYDAMYKWFAGLHGGLGVGTIAICTLVAAMTGLASTGTIATGMLAYPEMKKRGYDKKLSIGTIVAGGTLGPLIPPSLPAILVSAFSGLSVGKLFIAGVIPGLLCSLFFSAYILIRSYFNKSMAPAIPLGERASWKEKLTVLGNLIPPIFLVILVLGGIYNGAFTPSEAGGIGAAGTFVIALMYRRLTLKNLREAIVATFKMTGLVLWLAIGGACFASFLGTAGSSKLMESLLLGMSASPMGVLWVMMLIVFALGMFIDTAAIIMICVPIMMPVAVKLGFDPLWFGFLFVLCVIIGFITPPFGFSLFYFKGLGYEDVTMEDIYRSSLPWVLMMVVVLVLCILYPPVAMWLPNKMIK